MENKQVASFDRENEVYLLKSELASSGTDYYIVAQFDGKARRDRILSIDVLVSSDEADNTEKLLQRESRTIDNTKPGWFGKQIILGYMPIEKNGNYIIKVEGIELLGEIDNLSLSLHSNANRAFVIIVALVSFVLMASGFILAAMGLVKLGYNKLLQPTAESGG